MANVDKQLNILMYEALIEGGMEYLYWKFLTDFELQEC